MRPALMQLFRPVPQPSFSAPLKTHLLLERGVGLPTYTRASTATVVDFEGLLKTAKSGEARFEGARRVENLVALSEDFTSVAWGKNGTASVSANTTIAPNGTQTASTLSGATDNTYASNNLVRAVNCIASNTYRLSIYVKSAGATTVKISLRDNGTGAIVLSSAISLDGNWKRITLSAQVGGATPSYYLTVGSANGDVYIWGAQAENVTGQANQAPSEYVSVGVLSAPYHGAGVDGVKYFPYLNGNTVSGNIVTEAQGAPIPEVDLKGYLAEGSRTNLDLNSANVATGYNTTGGNTNLIANQIIAPDGTLTAGKLSETGTTATHYINSQSSIAYVSGTAYVKSVYAKAAENSKVGMFFVSSNFSSSGRMAWFNLATGTVGGAQSGVTASIVSVGNGWYRCSIAAIANASSSAVCGAIYLTKIGDFADSYLGTAGDGVYIWGSQSEQASFASSYIPTTTAAVTRSGDALTYPAAGNVNASAISKYVEFSVLSANATTVLNINDNTESNRDSFYTGFNTGYPTQNVLSGGVAQALITVATPYNNGVMHKLASSAVDNRFFFAGDGVQIGSTDTSGIMPVGLTTINIGKSSAVNSNLFGTIKNIKIYPKALKDSKLMEMAR
jgi:hypothetical protein